ncbi:hypothetical protein [Streptomyces sp. NPDC058252]|uniref:hypothetical protein n=1 Tax=Streptomyces sp. NPDC058252 TaxID=3346405 RepID=UPI0036E48A68
MDTTTQVLLGLGTTLLGYGLGVTQFAEKQKYTRMGYAITAVAVLLIIAGTITN